MRAEILSIGTELLLGQIIDTNAAYISETLASLGIDVYRRTTVGDNAARLAEAVKDALDHSDLIITSGGLGPTEDDLTKETVAEVLKEELVSDPTSEEAIRKYFHSRGVEMPKSNLKQALIYKSGIAIPNANGTAPGVLIEKNGKIVISLPGPPIEMKPMMHDFVIPYLRRKSRDGRVILSRVIRTVGIGESSLEEQVKDLLKNENPTVAPLAHTGEAHLRITAKCNSALEAESLLDDMEKRIRALVGEYVFGVDLQTLEEVVANLLLTKKKTISLAESCTGGLVADRLTNIPGISESLLCGMVTYSNEAKIRFLNVPKPMITEQGAVCRDVALAMADGVRKACSSDLGIGITGIAGPGGGSDKKPVGLVYIALNSEKENLCIENRFTGSRDSIKWKASQKALDMVRRHLIED